MITTITGENDVLRQQALQHIVQAFIAKHGDMGLERLDGEEASYDRMHEAAASLPFLAARKLVVLRAPGANKDFQQKFEDFAADIPETNDVVIVEPKLDKRLGYYKQLKTHTDFQDFPVLDAASLARYAVQYVTEQGGKLSAVDARALVERTGTNQLLLQHELDKLIAYNPAISRESIELLTDRTPASSIFELLDAAFAGNTARALQLYHEQRAQRVEPQQILAMLVWQLHIVAVVKAAGQRSSDAIAREAKISPYTISKTQSLARRLTVTKLQQLLQSLREYDVRLKSEALDADEVVQYYLLTLSAN